MKYLFAFTSLLLLAANHAQASQKWNCDEGDYHISLQLDKGATSFKYDICEFGGCAFSELKQTATLTFISAKASQYLYAISGPTSAESLILTFGTKDQLSQIDRENDSVVIESFSNCRLAN